MDPTPVVRKYIQAFNRRDTKAMAEWFACSGAILDGRRDQQLTRIGMETC